MSKDKRDSQPAGISARPSESSGRTEETKPRMDLLIDEALRDLTAGAPREGFRGRVLARIAATPEPPPVRSIGILGWRVRPFRLATAGAVAALGLAVVLVLPALLQPNGSPEAERETAARQPSAQPVPDSTQPPLVAEAQVASVPAQPPQRRATIQRAADIPRPRFGDEPAGTGTIRPVRVDPLPAPEPIVISAIEIQPIEIEQLTIADIQVPLLEAGRTPRDNRERE